MNTKSLRFVKLPDLDGCHGRLRPLHLANGDHKKVPKNRKEIQKLHRILYQYKGIPVHLRRGLNWWKMWVGIKKWLMVVVVVIWYQAGCRGSCRGWCRGWCSCTRGYWLWFVWISTHRKCLLMAAEWGFRIPESQVYYRSGRANDIAFECGDVLCKFFKCHQ